MPNPRLAARYAKSLLDFSVEKGQLEQVYADMQWLQEVCKSSRDFANMLRSPIIKSDVKGKIIRAVTQTHLSELTSAFNQLLVTKNRESYLPEICSATTSNLVADVNLAIVSPNPCDAGDSDFCGKLLIMFFNLYIIII